MREPYSIKTTLALLEKLSDSLNIGEDEDAPTPHESFVFWKVQSNVQDRLQARKNLIDVKHTDAELSLL